MRYVIAGASGLIGRALLAELAAVAQPPDVMVLSQSAATIQELQLDFPALKLSGLTYATLQSAPPPPNTDPTIMFNLAGENIGAKRVTKQRLQVLLHSRMKVLAALQQLTASCKVHLFIQASAIAALPDSDIAQSDAAQPNTSAVFTRTAPPRLNNLSDMALKLESAAANFGAPQLCVRLPLALSPQAPLVQKLRRLPPLFILDGSNYIPAASVRDCARALCFAAQLQLNGTLTINAPHYVTLQELMMKLGHPKLPALPLCRTLLNLGSKVDGRLTLFLENKKLKSAQLLQRGFTFLDEDPLQAI